MKNPYFLARREKLFKTSAGRFYLCDGASAPVVRPSFAPIAAILFGVVLVGALVWIAVTVPDSALDWGWMDAAVSVGLGALLAGVALTIGEWRLVYEVEALK